ncbi:hypothetical protein [Aquimarina algiphila]|uniref:hypothetical protein n=1 Tax=Aquimarina algiphila TaxID=2047982 RepID=UPI00232C3DC2|nr:hypothetical protein [Aquimarina algiphila]
MSAFIKRVELINRIDQLIRLQATGTPVELASRLGISKNKLYRILKNMRDLNAPIDYDVTSRNFVYQEDVVYFRFGFYPTKLYRNTQVSAYKKLSLNSTKKIRELTKEIH